MVATHPQFVCPFCHEKLVTDKESGSMCAGCKSDFPERSSVKVFLTEADWRATDERSRQNLEVLEGYSAARREAILNIQYFDWWCQRMFDLVPGHLNGHVLELMCGEAELTRRLPSRFQSATGLDLDPHLTAKAGKEIDDPRVRIIVGSATQIPLADNSIDVVLVMGGLHHARPLLDTIIPEIRRVLSDDGVLIVSEPANDHLITRTIRHLQYSLSSQQGNDEDEDGFTRPEIKAVLQRAGMNLETYEQFGFLAFPLIGNTDLVPLLRHSKNLKLGKALIDLDVFLERLPIIKKMAWTSIFKATVA